MSTGIKNGKDHAFNICVIFLFFLFTGTRPLHAATDENNNKKGRVIVIDAGHGGKDPGAIGSSSREKNITLAIALKTGEYIQKNLKNVTVIYTRKNDTFIELRDRPKIANKANADLFISIHANSAKSNIRGAETYVMGPAKDQANLEVAMNENSAMLRETDYQTKYEGFDPKSSESYIMFSLTQKVYQEQSTDLATRIQKQFRERVNRNDRDVKQAGFWVLFNTKMPSVLVETGFITNPEEEKYLNSNDGQNYLASSIARACKEYFNAVDIRSGISVQKESDQEISRDKPMEDVGADTTKISTTTVTTVTTVTSSTRTEQTGSFKAMKEAVQKADSEIVFMVQIKTSNVRKDTKPENFKGLGDISEMSFPGKYKYFSGKFQNYSDAVSYRKKVETLYPDAFIIAVKGNKLLPLQKALEEKRKPKMILNEKDLK